MDAYNENRMASGDMQIWQHKSRSILWEHVPGKRDDMVNVAKTRHAILLKTFLYCTEYNWILAISKF
jgi:hypothetical protein